MSIMQSVVRGRRRVVHEIMTRADLTSAPLTAPNASVVDVTYGAEEAAVVANLRARVNEIEARLKTIGMLG